MFKCSCRRMKCDEGSDAWNNLRISHIHVFLKNLRQHVPRKKTWSSRKFGERFFFGEDDVFQMKEFRTTLIYHIWVFPKNRGKTPKMVGENNEKALLRWMLWWNPLFSETSTYHIILDLIIYTCMLCVFILDFVSFVWSTEDYVQYMYIYIYAYMNIKNVMNWFIATSPCWDDWNSWDVFFMWQ